MVDESQGSGKERKGRVSGGKFTFYCPMCGQKILHDPNLSTKIRHHKEFGLLCSLECWDKADMRYTRMIMGKDDIDE